jgi:hypothetical protein
VNGRREGQGKMVWTAGEEYEGGWKNNLQQVYIIVIKIAKGQLPAGERENSTVAGQISSHNSRSD